MKAKTDIKPGRLHDALAAYRAAFGDHLDPKAAAVLDRLSSDERAAAAFAELGLNEGGAHTILTTCLEADELRRTFEGHVRTMLHEQRKDGRLDQLCKVVEELRLFANELNRQPDDRLSASLRCDPSVITEIKHGLYYLADAIEPRRRIAKETVRRLGATRKNVDAGKAANRMAGGRSATLLRPPLF